MSIGTTAVRIEDEKPGAWVFSAGLHAASRATVVRHKNGELLMTDGPFAEGKEHIGGFTIIKAPDLDAALEWASNVTSMMAPRRSFTRDLAQL